MTTINIAEIEARLIAALDQHDIMGGISPDILINKNDRPLRASDIRALLAALKAETARAEKAEQDLKEAEAAIVFKADFIAKKTSELSANIDDLQSQLTAANEKLAAAREEKLRLVEHCRLYWRGQVTPSPGRTEECLNSFNTGDINGR